MIGRVFGSSALSILNVSPNEEKLALRETLTVPYNSFYRENKQPNIWKVQVQITYSNVCVWLCVCVCVLWNLVMSVCGVCVCDLLLSSEEDCPLMSVCVSVIKWIKGEKHRSKYYKLSEIIILLYHTFATHNWIIGAFNCGYIFNLVHRPTCASSSSSVCVSLCVCVCVSGTCYVL